MSVQIDSGTAGGFHTVSVPTSITIDSATHTYLLSRSPNTSGYRQLCSIKVACAPPSTFGLALPLIQH